MTHRILCFSAVVLVVCCGRQEFPTNLPNARFATPVQRSRTHKECASLAQYVARDLPGKGGVPCNLAKQPSECLWGSFQIREPAFYCSGGWGMDSYLELAYVIRRQGDLVVYHFDTRGAQTRTVCPRESVSPGNGGFPLCNDKHADPSNCNRLPRWRRAN
jgi:hypothetical protein